jgi:hypothetical protein
MRNRAKGYPWSGEKIYTDEEFREEYWSDIHNLPENINKRFI